MDIKNMDDKPTNASLKIMLIMIAIMSIAFLSMPANAESGTITVTNHTNFAPYQNTPLAGSFAAVDFTKISVYTAGWNKIEQIYIDASAASLDYATNGKSTAFTITGCGSGGGTASYSKSSKALAWYFTNPSVVTCSPLAITYTTNIFTDITPSAGNFFAQSGAGATAATPIVIPNAAVNQFWIGTCNAPGCAVPSYISYSAVLDNSVSNIYYINYPAGGANTIFNTTIDKSGQTVSTRVIIENATGSPVNYSVQGDPLGTYNTNSWSVINTYGQGIALNMSTSVGDFTRVIVNTSGSTVPVPASTPTPPQAGVSGAAISWDKTSYNIGDIGTLTGNVTISPPIFGDIRITVVNSTGQQAFFVWDSSGTFPQIESFLFSFPSADTYTATLISHSPFSGDTILANATVQAVSPVSYIFAPTNAVTGSNISIKYKFNPAPTTGAIEDVQTDINGVGLPGIYFNTSLCGCDTNLHSLNYTINGVGKHTLRLWDTGKIKVVASTIVDVTATGTAPPQNISVNFLALDNTQYSVGDVINGQYQVSTTNWSGFGYFQASLISSGGVGMGSVTLTSQTGTFQIPVTGGEFGVFQSGAAFVNITAGNNILSSTNLMASAPVTILSTHGSYSVSANPVTICKSQAEVVKFTGSGGIGILQEIYMTPAGTTKINNYSFNQNGTRQFVYNDGTVINNGGIIYSVLDTNGNFQVNTIVKYISVGCTAPGITPPPGATPPPTGTQQANSLVILITSNIFWALLITVGLMITIAWRTKDGFPTGAIGVLVSGIFTFLGWLPAWIFFTMFVIGALFIAASIVEKQMRNVVQ